MNNFVGIDLGTTNSAICSYDGSEVRIWKSPEQNDVTPSAIYIDRRGNKHIGKRASDVAPLYPDNLAVLFKRLMGTSTPINFPAVNITKTPEECSAEVLRTLFGYLPEEIRNDPSTGTVITVPAAFNQMQKDATMQAANMADIGRVALMQEPVAAVMSVMRARNTDGMFLIYDLGGGTLDIAIAQSISGRVNLLAHGGIAMCGGRDFDRVIVDNIVLPWLHENFDLPEDLSVNRDYSRLMRMNSWAVERAKIELSAREDCVIYSADTQSFDLEGKEIYLEIPLRRETFNELIAERVDESIESARETLKKAGLSPHDLERIVFIGGPTNYKPLRDKVAFELGIQGSIDVNPMTAVAEGAALFAESIDWSSNNRSRKSSRSQLSSGEHLPISFNYISRTPDVRAKIAVQITGQVVQGFEVQIDSIDTGWTSGRLPLAHGTVIDVALAKNGDNTFKVFVFDALGSLIPQEHNKIIITRTAAAIDAIPASHSVAIEVLDKLGGCPGLDYLVRSGDSLPKKGKKTFKAGETLQAGTANSLNFKLWEGEIEEPIEDNLAIGVMRISGFDFDDGVISAGADIECEYEVLDSGNIILEISVPCIGSTFRSDKNFYSRQEGQVDYSAAADMIIEEGERMVQRIDEISEIVDDPKLEHALHQIESVILMDTDEAEIEKSHEAMERIHTIKRLLAQIRREHLREIRQIDLDKQVSFFGESVRQYARPSEITAFDNQAKTAQGSIDRNDRDFEHLIVELRSKIFGILYRQDWFAIDMFKAMVSAPHRFTDKHRFDELKKAGEQFIGSDDIEKLREVISQLWMIQIGHTEIDTIIETANIIRG